MNGTRLVVVHEDVHNRRKWPEGRPVTVRASSVDTLRGYPAGTTRCVLGIHGQFLHVRETHEEMVVLLGAYVGGGY